MQSLPVLLRLLLLLHYYRTTVTAAAAAAAPVALQSTNRNIPILRYIVQLHFQLEE